MELRNDAASVAGGQIDEGVGSMSGQVAQVDLQSEASKYIPKDYPERLYRIRHSAAHVMAQAVLEHFMEGGAIQFGGGPPIQDGFYYDFLLPRSATEADLGAIEIRMKKILREHHAFQVREVNIGDARSIFSDQPFKLELLDGLEQGSVDDNGNSIAGGERPRITVYSHGSFTDLCRGPHVSNTAEIEPDAVKVLSVAGAYWRGDERRVMLQRIYATAFETTADLEKYLWQREEAERRDHRKLGKELELFHFDETAPGMPYWLPKGQRILNELLNFWRIEHDRRGYQEISTPLINEKRLWETSGHWEHYRDNMFLIPLSDTVTYGVKPMNCPNAMVVFNLKVRSYRDLPLRLSDCDLLHRHESSGSMHGLLRVQKFQQDDAHIFVSEDQIEAEYDRIFEIAELFYSIFGMKYSFRLGTRPATGFIGEIATWDKAETALRRILDKHAGPGNYQVADGDGAFYGPKIDIVMEDALGRKWQMGTIQLDFVLPMRFDCRYDDRDGVSKTPVVIHRVIYGSLERFMGILIEHVAGAFPVWLAPVQAKLIPISDRHVEYADEVTALLKEERLRVETDDTAERMNYKIRRAQMEKVPYMLVVGDREAKERTVAVRLRNGKDLGSMSVTEFVNIAQEAIRTKCL